MGPLKAEIITFYRLVHSKLTWDLSTLSSPLKAPGYLGGGLPSLSSAL